MKREYTVRIFKALFWSGIVGVFAFSGGLSLAALFVSVITYNLTPDDEPKK